VVEASPEARRPLIYFATFSIGDNEHRKALGEDVLELLAEHETDCDNQSLLINRVVEAEKGPSRSLELLTKISRHMSADEFHFELIRAALTNSGFAAPLVKWLAREDIKPSEVTKTFLDKVRDGKAFSEAARGALWEGRI
jgi:hypothetical protein